jgi:hypothetical protein
MRPLLDHPIDHPFNPVKTVLTTMTTIFGRISRVKTIPPFARGGVTRAKGVANEEVVTVVDASERVDPAYV